MLSEHTVVDYKLKMPAMEAAKHAWAEEVKLIHLKMINFSQDAPGSSFTIDKFAPLMERRAGCNYICSQISPIRHPIDMSEDLHGPVVDKMGLQHHKQSAQADEEIDARSSSPSIQELHPKGFFKPLDCSHALWSTYVSPTSSREVGAGMMFHTWG